MSPKNIIFAIIIFLCLCNVPIFAQQYKNSSYLNDIKINNALKVNSSLNTLGIVSVFFPLNPILLIENKKFYVGITKEFSLIFYPVGRLAAEYSLIFRKSDLNQLRFSYNFDIPLETADFAAFLLSFGGGYFTDFKKYGFFPQASVSLLVPTTDNIAVNAYFKVRETFVNQDKGSDIFDMSFGLGVTFSF